MFNIYTNTYIYICAKSYDEISSTKQTSETCLRHHKKKETKRNNNNNNKRNKNLEYLYIYIYIFFYLYMCSDLGRTEQEKQTKKQRLVDFDLSFFLK